MTDPRARFTDDFETEFAFRDLVYVGPTKNHADSWDYLGPLNTPFRLAVSHPAKDQAIVKLLVPKYRITNYSGMPTIAFNFDAEVGTLMLPNIADLPREPAQQAAWFLEHIAKAQDEHAPETLRGTAAELHEIAQAFAHLSGRSISITCAQHRNENPHYSIDEQGDLLGDFFRAILRWFHPIGTAPNPLNGGSINLRVYLRFGEYEPAPLSGHERIELGVRLKDFVLAHAAELQLGPRAVATRFKLLGVI